jgi:hypothetical protein
LAVSAASRHVFASDVFEEGAKGLVVAAVGVVLGVEKSADHSAEHHPWAVDLHPTPPR